MSLNNGIYDIINLSPMPRCAGAPPGSIAVGTPVMAVSPPLMLPVEVKRVGSDTYQFKLQTRNNIALGYSERPRKDHYDFVKLTSEEALWSVDPGSDKGHFRIRTPNADRYWTLPGGAGGLAPILLSGFNESPQQEWFFQPLNVR